jgi:hypothetical protein
MTPEPPIACSLTAAEMPARLAEMSAIGQAGLLAGEATDRHAILRFRAGADMRERLEAVVAAEAQCCAFLKMGLSDEPGAVVLTVEAPEGAEPVLDEILGAFGYQEQGA